MGFGEWFQAKDIHCLHKIRKMSLSNNQWRATKKNEDRKITVAEEGWNLAGVIEDNDDIQFTIDSSGDEAYFDAQGEYYSSEDDSSSDDGAVASSSTRAII